MAGKSSFSTGKHSIYINTKAITERINKVAIKKIRDKTERSVYIAINKANRDLLKQFLKHAISQEIAAGPNATNISGTLGGYGNLFSFLGFEQGQKPVDDLADFLANSIDFNIKTTAKNVIITIKMPSKEEIEQITELPWITKSWVFAIEQGFKGLQHYLYDEEDFEDEEYSRSGTGIQVKNKIRTDKFNKTSYMSEILRNVSNSLIRQIKANLV